MTRVPSKQQHTGGLHVLLAATAAETIPHSSPENPLTLPETMDYPVGVHYLQVPNPRGMSLCELRYEFSQPSPGRAVVVELTVTRPTTPQRLRWEFRFIWTSWSLVAEFSESGELWQLAGAGSGPRTENQVRALYELADALSIRESAMPLNENWSQVKRAVLPQNWRTTAVGVEATRQQKMEELEDRAIIDMQLLAARSRRSRRRKADPETTVLESFLEVRSSAALVCKLFDLDWRRCVQRRFTPAEYPSKKQLVHAVRSLENLELAAIKQASRTA